MRRAFPLLPGATSDGASVRENEMLHAVLQDLRYGLRTLSRAPGFTAAAAVTLALGIAATTVLFTVVNGVLLRPLPYPDPDRLALLYSAYPQRGIDRGTLSVPDFRDWSARTRTVSRMGVYSTLPSALVLQDESGARELATAHVSWDVLPTLGVEPVIGRVFRQEEEDAAARVAVLSHAAWMRHFGGDPAILDRSVMLSDQLFRIVGIMPEGFGFPRPEIEAYALLSTIPADSIPQHLRFVRFLNAIGRLAPGITAAQAADELSSIAAALAGEHPESNAGLEGAAAQPLRQAVVGHVETALLVLFGAVGFVLLIACVNVANLLLARGVGRKREIAVRAALGASRARIVALLLAESLALALLAGAGGWLLAIWGVDALVAGSAGLIPRAADVTPDARAMAFACAVSVLTVGIFGVFPALAATRAEVSQQIREGGGDRGSSRLGARGTLVAAEVAIALVLLVGAGLLLRSLWTLHNVDPGFRTEDTLAVTMTMPSTRYAERAEYLGLHDELLARFRVLPGVSAAGSIRNLPMRGTGEQLRVQVSGRPDVPEAERPVVDMLQVTPDLFRALGVPLIRGRAVSDDDREGGPLSIVVNDTLARSLFAGEDALGQRLGFAGVDATIVGIVGDVHQRALETAPTPTVYVPLQQIPRRAMTFVLRTSGDPMRLAGAVAHAVRETDAGLAISDFVALDAVVSGAVARPRLFTTLLASFAALAVLLSAVGISAVVLFAVRQRTREIGIRMALGAPRGQTVRLMVWHGMAPVLAGMAVGLVAAAGLSRFMSALLFEVTPIDVTTYAVVALLLGAIAFLATYLPARRAAGIDPMVALRQE
ncbi:MAG: ABC transporter permease [Vicinamibacterales bacterium]|nr:ABC transporter permease [Vicinamibacterales bacterium]